MRTHRVLLPEVAAGRTTVTGAEAHHLRDVLRVRTGSVIEAFDGRGLEAHGRVIAAGPQGVELELDAPVRGSVEAAVELTLAVALLKGDKLAEVVRKGTELGVVRFRPFRARRADVPALAPTKLVRLRRVAEEAAKQSRRSRVPEVDEVAALGDLALDGRTLVASPAADLTLRAALSQGAPPRLTLVTGPEGGLAEEEVAALLARGAEAIRLGARILRAETAPVALAAAVLVPDAL